MQGECRGELPIITPSPSRPFDKHSGGVGGGPFDETLPAPAGGLREPSPCPLPEGEGSWWPVAVFAPAADRILAQSRLSASSRWFLSALRRQSSTRVTVRASSGVILPTARAASVASNAAITSPAWVSAGRARVIVRPRGRGQSRRSRKRADVTSPAFALSITTRAIALSSPAASAARSVHRSLPSV